MEELGSEEALTTFFTLEPVVQVMAPLMLQQMRSAGETFVADRTLVRLDPTVGDDVCFQLVRSIKLFGTT